MKRPAALFCLTLLPGPAAQAMDKPGPYAFELGPGKIHEVCLRVEAGQSRSYEWSADAATDFNIHYHQGDKVFYPVKKDGTRSEKGTFTAKSGEDYCWMWTARERTRVRGSVGD